MCLFKNLFLINDVNLRNFSQKQKKIIKVLSPRNYDSKKRVLGKKVLGDLFDKKECIEHIYSKVPFSTFFQENFFWHPFLRNKGVLDPLCEESFLQEVGGCFKDIFGYLLIFFGKRVVFKGKTLSGPLSKKKMMLEKATSMALSI